MPPIGLPGGAHVLVTGGASGIGLEVCKCLTERGAASVAILDVSRKALEAAAQALELAAGLGVASTTAVRTYVADVTDPAQVNSLARASGCSSAVPFRLVREYDERALA